MTGESRWEARWLARSAPARLLAAAFFGVVLAFTRNLTLPATLLVILAGILVWMVEPEPERVEVLAADDGQPDTTWGAVAVWGIVVLVFLLWEAGAFLLGNDDAHPTFSMLSSPILAWPPIRAVVAFAWMSWGWDLRTR